VAVPAPRPWCTEGEGLDEVARRALLAFVSAPQVLLDSGVGGAGVDEGQARANRFVGGLFVGSYLVSQLFSSFPPAGVGECCRNLLAAEAALSRLAEAAKPDKHHGRVSTFLTLSRIYTPPDSARGADHLPVPVLPRTDSFPLPCASAPTDF
jgi:hypothetical protein